MRTRSFRIKAVLFDFDGTLTRPGAIDFSLIRKAIGCPEKEPILEFICRIADPYTQSAARTTLNAHENAAAAASRPNAGAEELIPYLKSKNIAVGIISRNGMASIRRAFENFQRVSASDFDLMITRDDPVAPKPSADGILLAAHRFGVNPEELLVVGDFVFDIEAGKNAGALTAYLTNGKPAGLNAPESDFTVSDLMALKEIVRLGQPLPAGKLPNDLLGCFLELFEADDPAMILRPGVGEDVAAVDAGAAEVLVLKSDPITFATDSIGYYAVVVNANDIATSGAAPRWLLASLVFPCGTTPSRIRAVMWELQLVCRQWGITVCGGHTEISDAVSRPIVTGMLVGTVQKKHLIDKRNMASGDLVLFTKRVAVEGSAIIAREFAGKLHKLGIAADEIGYCRGLLSQLSVCEEAEIAARTAGVSAMHDVTEGGLATALLELSAAGRHRLHVDLDRIPYFSQTRRICRLLGIDPLGLIGSGSLLICCREDAGENLMTAIHSANIPVTCIGRVGEAGAGVDAVAAGRAATWPRFETDEITRLFNR